MISEFGQKMKNIIYSILVVIVVGVVVSSSLGLLMVRGKPPGLIME